MTSSYTAVVTGAAAEKSIGRAVAQAYAGAGWGLALLDLDGDEAATLAAQLADRHGVAVYGGAVDVAEEASVDAARAAILAAGLPPVGAVANIAGITSPVPFLDTTLELWNRILSINATGTYLVTRAFLPAMIEQGWGRIVNMSSVSAQRGGGVFGKVPYSASKAAVLGFTKALARELAATGVTVNAVAPGAVDTNIRVGSSAEAEEAIVRAIPVGRTATPEEVAEIILFLSSDAAAYLQGTTIDINGGSHLH